MKILILAAMDKEINLLLNILDNYKEINKSGINVYCGEAGNKEIYIAKCGIGKVNSAINTYRLIDTLHPDFLLNSGVAGGAGLPIGTVLVADKVAYHDVWCGPGTNYGQADGLPLFMQPSDHIMNLTSKLGKENKIAKGLICSGDKFISKAEEIKEIRSKFPEVKAVDMESAAIAQVCYMNNIPFGIIRVVSDTPGEGENISQYKNFWNEAPEKTFEVVKFVISHL